MIRSEDKEAVEALWRAAWECRNYLLGEIAGWIYRRDAPSPHYTAYDVMEAYRLCVRAIERIQGYRVSPFVS